MIVPGIRFVQGVNDYDDRDGVKYAIAIHNTSNDATDTGEASYAEWRPDGTSSHFYADADSVTQSLDTDDKAGHAGSSTGNENAIAVEITGTTGKSRDWWLANVAWDKLGAVLAAVIRHHWPDGSFQVRRASVAEMRSNPRVKAFYSHDDMRLAWGGTTHTDPGPSFPWDRLFAAVNAALEVDDMEPVDVWNKVNWGTQTAGKRLEIASVGNGAKLDQLITAAAADEARDKAALAAIQALAAPGGVDADRVINAVNAVRDQLGTEIGQLRAALVATEAERDALNERLAAALAGNEPVAG